MTNIQFILKSVAQQLLIFKTVQLLQKTVQFRLFPDRKDTTGNLDEVQIENIAKLQKKYEVIVKEKLF
jgi:uncharacterized protein